MRCEEFELSAREVTISSIDINSIIHGETSVSVEISVICSSGTYIRAIARDLGSALGVGGHLSSLRRTLVSPFGISECKSLESAEIISTSAGISRILPIRTITSAELLEISYGRVIAPNSQEGTVAALATDGSFAALLENKKLEDKIVAAPTLVSMKE